MSSISKNVSVSFMVFAFQRDVLSSLEGCSTGAADFFSGNESSVVFASVGMPSVALHESAEGLSVC